MPDLLAEAAFAARREQARSVARRAAAPHAARPDRRARRCCAPGEQAPERVARALGAELGWDERALRRRPSASAPTPPRRAWWSAPEQPSGPRRNFPPFRRLHRSDRPRPGAAASHDPPPLPDRPARPAGARRAARRRPAALVPGRRRSTARRPTSRSVGGVDLARDGTGGVVYIKRVDGVPHVFVSRFNGGQLPPARARRRRHRRRPRRRRDRGRRPRPPRDRLDGRQPGLRQRRAAATTSSPARCSARPSSTTTPRARSPTPRSTWASTAPPTRPTRRRAAAAPTSASRGCRTSRGPRSARRWTSIRRAAAGRGNQRARVARLGRGQRARGLGRGPRRRPRARVRAARHRARAVRGPAGALAPRLRRRGRRPRRLARHRHRGRRLVRVGRVPPGLRRRLAHDRAAAAGLDVRAARAARRRAGLGEPADRHQRPRPGPRGARGRRRRCSATSLYLDAFAPGQPLHFASRGAERRAGPAASEHREVAVAWRVGARRRVDQGPASSPSRPSRSRTRSRCPGPTSAR